MQNATTRSTPQRIRRVCIPQVFGELSISPPAQGRPSPVLFHYTEEHLQSMAGRVFAALRDGIIKPDVRHRYPLAAAADAHRDLEARRTSGQIVLLA